MANQKWDRYMSEIERLYIHENQTLEDVMSYMETQHSWKKRQAQFTMFCCIAADWRLARHHTLDNSTNGGLENTPSPEMMNGS